MFKISHKLNYFSHVNIFSRLRNKQKMSVVDKPLVSYMLSKKYDSESEEIIKKIGEQITETTSSILGFSGILSSISALSETKRKVETKQEQKNEKITSTKTQYFEKSKEAYEDYDDENDDYDSYDSYSSYVYHEKKQSLIARFMSNIVNSVSEIIYSIQDWNYQRKARKEEKRRMTCEMRNQLQYKIIENGLQTRLDKKLVSRVLSSKKISVKKLEKILKETDTLIEEKKLEEKRIQEQNRLNKLKSSYIRKLNQYRNMFADGDMYPELPELQNYQNYTFLQLQEAMNKLSCLIDHQKIIKDLKKRYQEGAEHYAGSDENDRLKSSLPGEINPDYDKSGGRQYRKELKRICKLFLIHSRIVGRSIDDFKNVSKTYYSSAKNKIEEIYELKGNLRAAEMVPFVGVLPKAVRVADQYNLTKCILHDFEDITQKYVKNGIQLKIKKYGEQYDKIEEFTKAHKHSSKDKQYTEIMLNMINNVKKEHIGVYAKLYSDFIQAGLSIKHICYNIRLKDGMSLAIKTVYILASAL